MKSTEKMEEVIEEYSNMVYRIALTRTGNLENTEDIFQEVFIKYATKSPKFESKEHEKAWLIRVTINLSKNLNKSSWNTKTESISEELQFKNKEEENVFSVVNTLPQNYKTVIYLFYYEGYKVREIARLMKKQEGTIKTWLSRAREILKEKLKGGFEDE